jgi:hypothetical protein
MQPKRAKLKTPAKPKKPKPDPATDATSRQIPRDNAGCVL